MNGEKAESIPLASWASWSKSQISFSYKFGGTRVVIQFDSLVEILFPLFQVIIIY